MTQLVQERLHPSLGVLEVGQHPGVALAVGVETVRVWVLALAVVQIAAGQDVVDGQAYAGVVVSRQVFDAAAFVVPVQVEFVNKWRPLEERIVVVPGHQLRRGNAVALGQDRVQLLLLPGERLAGQRIQFVEDAVELCDILLARDDGHGVVVVEAEFLRRPVAELHQAEEVLDDDVADLLAGAPGRLTFGGVLFRRHERVDIAHGDILPVDAASVAVVGLLDLRVELHDLREQLRLDLVLEIGVVELIELAGQTRIGYGPGLSERLDACEVLSIAVELPDLQLQRLIPVPRLLLAGCGGLPVRQIGLRPERSDLRHMRLDEAGQSALLRHSLDVGQSCGCKQQNAPDGHQSHVGSPDAISRTGPSIMPGCKAEKNIADPPELISDSLTARETYATRRDRTSLSIFEPIFCLATFRS